MKILYLPNAYSQQRQYEKPRKIYPVLMAMEAEWYRKQGHEVIWSGWYHECDDTYKLWTKADKVIREPEGLPFLELPHPDRIFTWADHPMYMKNGNFKYLPATYIQSARDCWWRKCTFCKWAKKYLKYEVRDYLDVWNEIEECDTMGFKEVFDDSGTFPTGEWLENFLDCVPYDNPYISCNMRFGTNPPYQQMKFAKFRMLLYGLESANQDTLNRINKGIDIDKAVEELKVASKAGLEPHIAFMFGYPWETDEDAIRTLKLVWWLLRKGYAKTAQASLYDPPDGIRNEGHRKYVNKLYHVAKYPDFWLTKLRDIHCKEDLKYLWKSIKAAIRR